MATIKAIETHYKGYRFRSRLEARWAVFFDALGLKWEYEPQGYDLDGVWYLPDFWLPALKRHIEIKPTISPDELDKPHAFARTGEHITVLCGVPWPWEYGAFFSDEDTNKKLFPMPTAQWTITTCCSKVGFHFLSCDGAFFLARLADHSGDCHADGCLEPKCQGCFCPRPGASFDERSLLWVAYRRARSARFEHGESP